MGRKPFEIVAECEMPAFPTGADITHVSEQMEKARRSRPDIARATANPPAIYREKRYVLQMRLVVWAEDASRALQAAKDLLGDAGLPCRTVLPSGRALIEADVPRPSEPMPSGQVSSGGRPPAPRRAPRKRKGKSGPRAARGAVRRRTHPR